MTIWKHVAVTKQLKRQLEQESINRKIRMVLWGYANATMRETKLTFEDRIDRQKKNKSRQSSKLRNDGITFL